MNEDNSEEIGSEESSGSGNTNSSFKITNPFKKGNNSTNKQGCSTFICGVIVLFVIFCKITDTSFDKVTSKYIDYSDIQKTFNLELDVFPTNDSYTALIRASNFVVLINAADNLNDDRIQDILNSYTSVTMAFLLSDTEEYNSIDNVDSIYAASKFNGNYFSKGSYTEGSLAVENGILYYLFEDDNLKFDYTKYDEALAKVILSNNELSDECDFLINSENNDKSALSTQFYFDNNDTLEINLRDYDYIKFDLTTGETSAKLLNSK